jgi:GTP cyclohydrolase III
MLYLPGGGAMLFLTDVDHVSFEKANETRQNNLQSATVSLQVVIGLCKRKETAALKIKAAAKVSRVSAQNQPAQLRFFSFPIRRGRFKRI